MIFEGIPGRISRNRFWSIFCRNYWENFWRNPWNITEKKIWKNPSGKVLINPTRSLLEKYLKEHLEKHSWDFQRNFARINEKLLCKCLRKSLYTTNYTWRNLWRNKNNYFRKSSLHKFWISWQIFENMFVKISDPLLKCFSRIASNEEIFEGISAESLGEIARKMFLQISFKIAAEPPKKFFEILVEEFLQNVFRNTWKVHARTFVAILVHTSLNIYEEIPGVIS